MHAMPKGGMPKLDYKQTPFLIIWETTQACDLTCSHCRASAQPNRDPGEMTTAEGKDLLDQASEMGTPIFILSGGDPLKREDLYELISYGASLGLRMATIPAATERLTEDVVRRLKEAGCSQMALSLDFPSAEQHDAFRGSPGAFARTMKAVEWAHKHGMPLQINSTLHSAADPYLEEMVALVKSLGIVFWEVFFLVPMGRGSTLQGLTAEQCEEIFEVLYKVQKENKFLVKVTEAPHYRRYVAQREAEEAAARPGAGNPAGAPAMTAAGRTSGHPGAAPVTNLPSQLIRTEGPGHSIGLATQGVNSGNGFLFISHVGEIFPSGFLPLRAGSLREGRLAEIYRESPLMKALRDPDRFTGVCGVCEYNRICGGSRSRAYALLGSYQASDPWCNYRPSGYVEPKREAGGLPMVR